MEVELKEGQHYPRVMFQRTGNHAGMIMAVHEHDTIHMMLARQRTQRSARPGLRRWS